MAAPIEAYFRFRLLDFGEILSSLDIVQRLNLETKLEVHNGCVNTICWNEAGTLILSGSDDQRLCITDPFTKKRVVSIQSGHLANIFSAKFLPNTEDNQVVSCSGDGMIQYTIVDRPDQHGQHPFACHFGTTYELVTVPQDSNTFLSCGEDGTVRWFDLRIKDTCVKDECKEDILINCRRAVTAIAINPLLPYQLSVGCSDSTVRIFDRRMLGTRATGNYTGRSTLTGMVSRFTAPLLEGHSHRVTSLSYSTDGTEVLASYSSEQLYLFNLNEDGSKEFQTDVIKTPQQKEGSKGDTASSTSPRHLPIKRLRLRGDWSDTGPNARPERERSPNPQAPAAEADGSGDDDPREPIPAEVAGDDPPPPPPPPPPLVPGEGVEPRSITIMQRMSDMLTRWLEGATRQASDRQGALRGNSQEQDVDANDQPPAAELPLEGATGEDHGEAQSQLEALDANVAIADVATAEGTGAEKLETKSQKSEPELREADEGEDVSKSVDNCTDCEAFTKGEHAEETVPQSQTATTTNTQSESVIESNSECQLGFLSEESQAGHCQAVRATASHRQDLEPLVSLRYSRESTSAATITMDFPESGTTGGPNLPPEVCAYSTPEMRISPPKVTGSVSMSPVDVPVTIASKSYVELEAEVLLSHVEVPVSTPKALVEDEPSISSPSVQVAANDSALPVKITNDASMSSPKITDSAAMSSVKVKSNACSDVSRSTSKSPVAIVEETLRLSETVKSCSSEAAEEQETSADVKITMVDNDDDNNAADGVVDIVNSSLLKKPAGSVNADVARGDTSADEYKDNSHIENIASAADVGESADLAASAAEKPDAAHTLKYYPSDDESSTAEDIANFFIDPSDGSSEPSEPPGGGDERLRRLASTNRVRSVGGSEVVPPDGGRQRRYGHSGPPTGNFQLHSPPENDSDDELTSASSHRDEVERNRAAIRLQEMYRKRLQEREQEEQQLLNIHQPRLKQVYRGHRNARTMIKEAAFWGDDFVMSGSDCGHIFVWDRHTAELVMLLEGDKHVVNCLQPHPLDPVLASSGIDYDIKVWMPTEQTPSFDTQKADEVVSRNRVMLEETRDTITVPASFMLRMLASLSHIRSGRRQGDGNSSSSDDE